MDILKSNYYTKPEGQDYAGKMIATNRFILMGAIPMATADVLMYSHSKGYLATIAGFAKWIGPAMGMATAFTTVTYAANHIRGKDDTWNYALGGMAAGAVFGKAVRSRFVGFQMSVVLALAGMIKKVSIMEGWTFYPTEEEWRNGRVNGSLFTAKHDWTLMKDPEKGWTTGRD